MGSSSAVSVVAAVVLVVSHGSALALFVFSVSQVVSVAVLRAASLIADIFVVFVFRERSEVASNAPGGVFRILTRTNDPFYRVSPTGTGTRC